MLFLRAGGIRAFAYMRAEENFRPIEIIKLPIFFRARKSRRGSKRRAMRRHIGNSRDCGGGRRAHCAYGGRFRQGTAIRRIPRISCGFEKAEVNGEIAPALRKLAAFPVMRWKWVWGEPTCRKFLKSGGRTIRKIRFITAAKNGRERAIALFNCLTKFSIRKLDIFKNRFHKY